MRKTGKNNRRCLVNLVNNSKRARLTILMVVDGFDCWLCRRG